MTTTLRFKLQRSILSPPDTIVYAHDDLQLCAGGLEMILNRDITEPEIDITLSPVPMPNAHQITFDNSVVVSQSGWQFVTEPVFQFLRDWRRANYNTDHAWLSVSAPGKES